MSDYLISGRKGNGKSIFAIGVIRDALLVGKRVATNIDVYVDKLLPPTCKGTITRLPDTICVEDLEFLGRGQSGVVENDNGIIVLDECSRIFNSRSWGDKSRQPMLDWLVHSRKLGWDVYMIAQGPEQLDKQLRSTLLEYWVSVRRTDKWPIPFVTPIVRLLSGIEVSFPKMHIGTIRHGFDRDSLKVGRKYYKGAPLYPCYDTQQIFLERSHPAACGIHTILSPWLVKGRYLPPTPSLWEQVWPLFALTMAAFFWLICHLDPRGKWIELHQKDAKFYGR